MKNFFGDKDKDGVKNMFDCQPRNPKKQDTYIYLSKKKDKDKETMYTYSHPRKKAVKRIFIGGKYKRFDFDRPGQIGGVARVIGHEELHGVLDREGLWKASEKLDIIAKPTEMATNPQTGEGVFLFPEKEKEIVGVKGRQDVLNVYDNLTGDKDKDGVSNVMDCDPNDPNKQDSDFMIVDYVLRGIKPFGEILVDVNDMRRQIQVERYIKDSGLQFSKRILEKPIFEGRTKRFYGYVISKTGVDISLDTRREHIKSGRMLGYPEKAIKGFIKHQRTEDFNPKNITMYDIQYNLMKKGIPYEDFEYLEFSPYSMSVEEVKSEIQKRKAATREKPKSITVDPHFQAFVRAKDKNPNLTYNQWAWYEDPEGIIEREEYLENNRRK